MKDVTERLRTKFTTSHETHQRDDLAFLSVSRDQAIEAVKYLRDSEGFTHLVLLTAVDWMEDGIFQLTYLLNNPTRKVDLGVRVQIPREEPVMESAHRLWQTAATYQRELYEMFRIEFPGSPRMTEPFILDENWQGPPPYRREFDTLKYSQETYFPRPGRSKTDPAEYMKEQLYPEG